MSQSGQDDLLIPVSELNSQPSKVQKLPLAQRIQRFLTLGPLDGTSTSTISKREKRERRETERERNKESRDNFKKRGTRQRVRATQKEIEEREKQIRR